MVMKADATAILVPTGAAVQDSAAGLVILRLRLPVTPEGVAEVQDLVQEAGVQGAGTTLMTANQEQPILLEQVIMAGATGEILLIQVEANMFIAKDKNSVLLMAEVKRNLMWDTTVH